jgi:hypothetical protein
MLELFFRKRRGLFLLVALGVAAGILLVLQLPRQRAQQQGGLGGGCVGKGRM